MYIPDYTDMFNAHDAEQQREAGRLPKCDYCGKTIMDEHLYDINGDVICEDCMKDNFRKPVENYIE